MLSAFAVIFRSDKVTTFSCVVDQPTRSGPSLILCNCISFSGGINAQRMDYTCRPTSDKNSFQSVDYSSPHRHWRTVRDSLWTAIHRVCAKGSHPCGWCYWRESCFKVRGCAELIEQTVCFSLQHCFNCQVLAMLLHYPSLAYHQSSTSRRLERIFRSKYAIFPQSSFPELDIVELDAQLHGRWWNGIQRRRKRSFRCDSISKYIPSESSTRQPLYGRL
jgi:hypothetical protein